MTSLLCELQPHLWELCINGHSILDPPVTMMSRICIAALFLLLCWGEVSPATNLTFMFITSFGQFGFNSSGAVPAADMALEDINSNANVLPGYHLAYDRLRDSEVQSCVTILHVRVDQLVAMMLYCIGYNANAMSE